MPLGADGPRDPDTPADPPIESDPNVPAGGPVPPTDRRLMAAAAVLLAVPVVALMWVPSYSRITPRLGAFPFFFWYQFLWVFLCSACTYGAYRLTLAARRGATRRGGRS